MYAKIPEWFLLAIIDSDSNEHLQLAVYNKFPWPSTPSSER